MTPMLVLHVGALLYAVWLCYKTRHISTEFQEGKWISIAMVSNLQIICFGVLILIMLGSGPIVSYVIRCCIIFLNDMGVLLVIFVPKVYALLVEKRSKARKIGIADQIKSADGMDNNMTVDQAGEAGSSNRGSDATRFAAALDSGLRTPSAGPTGPTGSSTHSTKQLPPINMPPSQNSAADPRTTPNTMAAQVDGIDLRQLVSPKEDSAVSQESVTSLSPRR